MPTRTAGEAGWHESRYNLRAPLPGTSHVAIANLYRGTCAVLGELELYLLSVVEELDEGHPAVERLARRGLIANFDERAAVETTQRAACTSAHSVSLTICPTMGCNFDCPYCFEHHGSGGMSQEVQDDVVTLAGRMLDASHARTLRVVWYGGEPLLAPSVVESLSARLMDGASAHGVEYQAEIITNGYLLSADLAEMLGRAGVERAQITLDGIGSTHDATRRLAGGAGTFDRIVRNLSRPGLPFAIRVRQNVHAGNRDQTEDLRRLVAQLAAQSGNDLRFSAAPVMGNVISQGRDTHTVLLGKKEVSALVVARAARSFEGVRGSHCGAQSLWDVGIDEQGRLHKCWEAVDKPRLSFGTAHSWDPADPIATASNPDRLTAFLNTTGSVPDSECRECVWLPVCTGGCPYQRLFGGGKRCVAYRDDPEAFVRTLSARIQEAA